MKKRWKCLIAILIAIWIWIPSVVFSATDGGVLSVDNANRYEGMDKPYSQGYLPKVSDGKVHIRLPLVASSALLNDMITVTPNLGDPATSPFVFTNLEKTVKLAEHAVNGGEKKVSSYLIDLTLPLDANRVNGRYPLLFHVKYATADGTQYEQTFTLHVTISDRKDPNPSPTPVPTPEPTPKPIPQPKVIVSQYEVTPETVTAGEEFDVSFTLKNTSDRVNVQNLKITLKPEGTDLIMAEQSNTRYLKSLGKGKSKKFSFHMKARQDAQPKPQKLIISLEYEDDKATAISGSEEMTVQVKQPIRIEFDSPNIPASVNAGDTFPINLNVFNMGRGMINNVMCKVEAPGLIPEGNSFLGHMEPGSSKTAEIFVFVGTKNMSSSDEGETTETDADGEKYGKVSGIILVSYEDEFGQEYKEEIPFDTNINPPVVPEPSPEPEEEQPKASQWWVSIVIAGLIIVGLTVGIVWKQKKQRERIRIDEAD